MQNPFDRHLVAAHRQRAVATYDACAFLKKRVCEDLATRLTRIRRTFHQAVDLGCHTAQLANTLKDILPNPLICTDLSPAMVAKSPSPFKVVLDEEHLPFASNSLDLVISALSLHWINDWPGFLGQTHQCLKPDGLFMTALFGGETLRELRDCLASAELEMCGGISPRVSPMLSVKDAGDLLQQAGFALPVVDLDSIVVSYDHPLALLSDLRGMGEANALHQRESKLSRAVLSRACELYQRHHATPDGAITATFDVITLTGWKPHPSQPLPARRGSGTAMLGDFV